MPLFTGPCFLHHSPYYYANDPLVRQYKEERYPTARFVEEIVCCKNKLGNWYEFPGVVFYEENPPGDYSKFFAFQKCADVQRGVDEKGIPYMKWVLVGLKDFNPQVNAILVKNEDTGGATLAISRFGHDFVTIPGTNASIDGGRDYIRTLGDPLPLVVPYNVLTRTFTINGETYNVQPQIW